MLLVPFVNENSINHLIIFRKNLKNKNKPFTIFPLVFFDNIYKTLINIFIPRKKINTDNRHITINFTHKQHTSTLYISPHAPQLIYHINPKHTYNNNATLLIYIHHGNHRHLSRHRQPKPLLQL